MKPTRLALHVSPWRIRYLETLAGQALMICAGVSVPGRSSARRAAVLWGGRGADTFGMSGVASINKLLYWVQVLTTRMESAQTSAPKIMGFCPFFALSLCSAASAAVVDFAERSSWNCERWPGRRRALQTCLLQSFLLLLYFIFLSYDTSSHAKICKGMNSRGNMSSSSFA